MNKSGKKSELIGINDFTINDVIWLRARVRARMFLISPCVVHVDSLQIMGGKKTTGTQHDVREKNTSMNWESSSS